MRLKSLAGRISVHGNSKDDKNLYRDLLRAFPQGGGGDLRSLREYGSVTATPLTL